MSKIQKVESSDIELGGEEMIIDQTESLWKTFRGKFLPKMCPVKDDEEGVSEHVMDFTGT